MSLNAPWVPVKEAENASQPLLIVCIVFAVLETLFITAFIFSWHFNKDNNSNNTKGVYAYILIGYIFCFGGIVVSILKITKAGAGKHEHALQPTTIRTMLQLIKAHEIVYILSIPFPKLAILCLYLRLFTTKLTTFLIHATGVAIVATALFGLISTFANCRPFHAFWDRTVHAQCTMDVMTVFQYYSIPNIATDVVLLILPLPALYKLNVSMSAKAGLGLTFIASTLGIVTAILRFIDFLKTDLFHDVTYSCVSTTSWSVIEPGVYLIAATIPTLQPLIRRIFARIFPCSFVRTATVPSSFQGTVPDTPKLEPPRLTKKSSTKELMDTIGRRPSRVLRLDDYHNARYGSGVRTMSVDEESMVCADAIVHEAMGRQGRNPDGTLRVWSLQPVEYSPLRTSFFWDKESA